MFYPVEYAANSSACREFLLHTLETRVHIDLNNNSCVKLHQLDDSSADLASMSFHRRIFSLLNTEIGINLPLT